MIIGTVALPVWKSKDIAWLCMESLCRMHKPKKGWELIVFEENHPEAVGVDFINSYGKRLGRAGCERLIYMTCDTKYPLSQKWVKIANDTSATSEYFCLCAADNYYSPYMLQDAEALIKQADWCISTKGYFYDFNYDKVLRYNLEAPFGLQMIARTELVRKFPDDIVNRGVDRWFSEQIGNNMLINNDHWKQTLCTNGMNNISFDRHEVFKQPEAPFFETDIELENIVPDDISKRIKNLCQKSQ